jgi:hypothetical protein
MGSAGIWRNCAFVRETNFAPIPFPPFLSLTPAPSPFSATNSIFGRSKRFGLAAIAL